MIIVTIGEHIYFAPNFGVVVNPEAKEIPADQLKSDIEIALKHNQDIEFIDTVCGSGTHEGLNMDFPNSQTQQPLSVYLEVLGKCREVEKKKAERKIAKAKAREARDTPASLYVMRQLNSPFLLKVGISNDPETRLLALQNGSGSKLRLLYEYPFTKRSLARKAEGGVHEILAKKRTHGEWFNEVSDNEWRSAIDFVLFAKKETAT